MSSAEAVDVTRLDVPRDGIPDLTHGDISSAVVKLAHGTGPFAVDTERAMGIRYSARAYLVQIRRNGAGTFLIDPVGIEDQLGPLADVLASDEWVLHAADQDLPCLHELGLYPPEVFDTELAGLLLGFPRVSLQAEVAEVLGYGLAKEHSNSDWSQRPLAPELRAYAALDVELLVDLRDELTAMLRRAGRLEWLHEECEEVRLREPKPPKEQPWRKAAQREGIRDRRALGMLRALWNYRDSVARARDIAPERIISSRVLASLAKAKPRSRQDVVTSPLMQKRDRRRFVSQFWDVIAPVWSMEHDELPERVFHSHKEPFPNVRLWDKSHPEEAARWRIVRTAVLARADELGIRQDILLKPLLQKELAWDGWDSADEIPILLAALGARPWQVENTAPWIVAAARRPNAAAQAQGVSGN
ncbi:MAG: HRDC domain-containing protein [Ancrocorticia sp.]|jgi:ribonuclease D|nr:HRDC domain-containing protein [Ancrocorticia sp.]MCI1932358.1 HRDC domain-containing protein [Ancrocorticia sp.]MCI2012324.1 HRDC domain-containing protein [Ancrocorticia sp.]MCI2028955.1 HRDC domain-containing protein [Ancrocorticia sp.]MCI2178878.1 HRDC domain-containing protein [Ancrocorticia sp.]